MNIGHVSGGTNAGWKRQKERGQDWSCPKCLRSNKKFNANCPNCYTPRGSNG